MRLAASNDMTPGALPSSEQLASHRPPHAATCLNLFGGDRWMAESNFPLEKMGNGHGASRNALRCLAAGATAEEKAAIFAGAARRVAR